MPLSKFEPNESLNDRYAAMEKRLAVRDGALEGWSWAGSRAEKSMIDLLLPRDCCLLLVMQGLFSHDLALRDPSLNPQWIQIVRKRLNRPLTLAEKVRSVAILGRGRAAASGTARARARAR